MDSIHKLPKQKNENSRELRLLHDRTFECVMAIRNIGIETKNWDPLLNHILLQKLSSETIKTYECQLANIREPQSFSEFLQFIENRFMAISSAENKSESTEYANAGMKQETFFSKRGTQVTKCLCCNKEHYTYKCETFLKLEPTKRFEWAKAEKVCFNCLYKHKINECKSKRTCNECSKKHHTVLHFSKSPHSENRQKMSLCAKTENEDEYNEEEFNTVDEVASSSQTFAHVAAKCTSAILPTALVCVSAINGEKKLFFFFLVCSVFIGEKLKT